MAHERNDGNFSDPTLYWLQIIYVRVWRKLSRAGLRPRSVTGSTLCRFSREMKLTMLTFLRHSRL